MDCELGLSDIGSEDPGSVRLTATLRNDIESLSLANRLHMLQMDPENLTMIVTSLHLMQRK